MTIQEKAKQIADIVSSIDNEYRGNLFMLISKELRKDTQFYTANLFYKMGKIYGVKDE